MSIRKIAVAALVATSFVTMPIAAQAAKARHSAVTKVNAVRKGASHDGVDSGTLIIGGLAVAAVIGGIILISDNGSPKSP